jgi:hypothetical protein
VVAFVGKEEGPANLIQAVHQAFEIWPHLSRLASSVSERIDYDHSNIRSQARQNYRISMIMSILGFLIIVAGIILASFVRLMEIGIVGTATGLILEAMGYLFFRQLENANRRMDIYHQQLLQTDGIEFLLAIAARLPAKRENACTEQIISAVLSSWYPAGMRPESFSVAQTNPNGKKASPKEILESLSKKE